jgi:EmrB/QacA subfamily drug resistance transporter
MSDDQRSLQRTALSIAVLSSFLTPFVGSSVNIALPSIGAAFEADAVTLSWIATAYLLATAISLVPFGRLADIHGRRRIYGWGIGVFTLASLLCGLSPSIGMLLLWRVVQGVGSAMIFATGIAILTSVFPPGERGKALGIAVAAVYIGLSLGPFLGGIMVAHLTWRSVFVVLVPLGLINIWLVFFRLNGEWAEARGERFDAVGSLIYALALITLMYGIILLPRLHGLWLIGAGIAGLAGFAVWEQRVSQPVFEVRLFRHNRAFAFSNLAALFNYSATFGVTFLMSLYLQYIGGLTPQGAGAILIAAPITQAVLSPFAGRLSDRIEPRIVASIGMSLTTLGLILLSFLHTGTGRASILAILILLGTGFALFSSPNTNAIMSSVERRFYGIASGSVGTMRVVGQLMSMGIATVVLTVIVGRVQITPEHHEAFVAAVRLAFSIFAALCLTGIFASLARGRTHWNEEAPEPAGRNDRAAHRR